MISRDINLYQISKNYYSYRFSANNINEYVYFEKTSDGNYQLNISDRIMDNKLLGPLKQALEADKLVVSEIKIDSNYPCASSHYATIYKFLAAELPKNQLTFLSLDSCIHLEKQSGLMDLIKGLKDNYSLNSLEIPNCGFTDAEAVDFGRALCSLPKLKNLTISGYDANITELIINELVNITRQPNNKLLSLKLSGCLDQHVPSLVRLLTNPHCHLESLNLSFSKLTDVGAITLGKILVSDRTLKVLDLLNDNNVKNQSLKSLDLSYNSIGDQGAKILSAALSLDRLNLERNENISVEGLKALRGNLKTKIYLTSYVKYSGLEYASSVDPSERLKWSVDPDQQLPSESRYFPIKKFHDFFALDLKLIDKHIYAKPKWNNSENSYTRYGAQEFDEKEFKEFKRCNQNIKIR